MRDEGHAIFPCVTSVTQSFSVRDELKELLGRRLSRKRSFLKTLFKSEELENADLVFKGGQKNIGKTKLFENDDVMMTMIFSWPNTNPK